MAGITAPLTTAMKVDAKAALAALGRTGTSYSARELRHFVIQWLVSTGLSKNQAIASSTGQRWFTVGANVIDGVFASVTNAQINVETGLD